MIDAATEQPAWTLEMDLGVRPMTFTGNPDGSTKWIFVQLTGFNGFAVVDFATHKEIQPHQESDLPPGKATVPEGSDPSHGMAVTAGRQDAGRVQPVEQLSLLVLAARPESQSAAPSSAARAPRG